MSNFFKIVVSQYNTLLVLVSVLYMLKLKT